MGRRSRKLPDLGLGQGLEPEVVEQGDDDAEPLTDDELGLSATSVNPSAGTEVIRLEAHETPQEAKRRKTDAREYAQRFTRQAINRLAKALRSPDDRVAVTAALGLLARGHGQPPMEGKGPGDGAENATTPAELQARLDAIARLQQDPAYVEALVMLLRGSKIVKDPNEPAEVVAETEQELIEQLVEEPEPEAPIEVEAIRERCYCGCDYDEHPSGGQCNTCVRCHLYSPITAALEHRRAITDGTH